MPFATTGMDLEGYYAKWNKSDRERQIFYDYHLYVESKKIQQTSEYDKKERLTDIENKPVVTSREREGRRGNTGVED